MAARRTPTLMTALGFTAAADRIYERIRIQSGRELISVADALLRTPEELIAELAPLLERGVVRVESGRVYAATPAETVALMLAEADAAAAQAQGRLREVGAALPHLDAAGVGPAPGEVREVTGLDGEISSGGQVVGLLRALIGQSRGDLLWLRPDQWRDPRQDAMADVVRAATEEGRASRAIYPVRALHDAPETLTARAEAGEEVRLLPELPTRMLVIGRTHAILPEPLGFADEPRSLIRQPGIVEALTMWFDLLWDRASPLATIESADVDARPDLRRFLLEQLAAGAQDEQIARRLGVSLRTVRRRVADLLAELGADSRFQAGVEATRRGWL